MFCKKVLLRNSTDSQENTCTGVFFKKNSYRQPAALLQRRLRHKYFPISLVNFLRISILKNWRNGRDWRKTSEANQLCTLNIKVFGSSLKACLERDYANSITMTKIVD